jgi:hypothetical protein
MALRKKGRHNYGDDHSDLQDELRDYSRQNGCLATQFANALCSCGGTTFRVQLDEEEGAAVRTCLTCGLEHAVADSAGYLTEATLEECGCPCGSTSFEMSVGLALYAESQDVKWLYLGLRCLHCGLVACYGDWKNEYIGYEDLLQRV